jgi:hypothetical protein
MRHHDQYRRRFVDATGANFDPNCDVVWTVEDLRGMQADARSKWVRHRGLSPVTRHSHHHNRHDRPGPANTCGSAPRVREEP